MALEASPPLLRPQHEENGGGVGREGFWSEDSVKSAIDAGLDAIVTSFSLISSISATRLASGHCTEQFNRDLEVVNVFSKYQDILVDEKMTAQKGVLPPRQTEKPWKSGLISFAAFILFGNVPLLSFVVLIPFTGDDSTKFFGACLLSALALALLGLARAKISGQYLHSVAATLFNGGIAATCAYLIGWMLRNAAGLHDQTKGH